MSIPDNTENDGFSFKMAMARTDILKSEKGIATAKSMCNSSFRGCIRSIIGREDGSLGNFVKKLLVVIKTKQVKQARPTRQAKACGMNGAELSIF